MKKIFTIIILSIFISFSLLSSYAMWWFGQQRWTSMQVVGNDESRWFASQRWLDRWFYWNSYWNSYWNKLQTIQFATNWLLSLAWMYVIARWIYKADLYWTVKWIIFVWIASLLVNLGFSFANR